MDIFDKRPHTISSQISSTNGRRIHLHKHTYLAQEIPWSRRGFSQSEALPLHSGLADLCDRPKCGRLGCVISGSWGLRSRYPLNTCKAIYIPSHTSASILLLSQACFPVPQCILCPGANDWGRGKMGHPALQYITFFLWKLSDLHNTYIIRSKRVHDQLSPAIYMHSQIQAFHFVCFPC